MCLSITKDHDAKDYGAKGLSEEIGRLVLVGNVQNTNDAIMNFLPYKMAIHFNMFSATPVYIATIYSCINSRG